MQEIIVTVAVTVVFTVIVTVIIANIRKERSNQHEKDFKARGGK